MESSQIFPRQRRFGTKVPIGYLSFRQKGEIFMTRAVIDRVMYTYGMLVNLSLDEELAARKKVTEFLARSKSSDENKLAVEGIKFLRGPVKMRVRRARS